MTLMKAPYEVSTLRQLGRDILEHTSAHGIPNVFRSRHWFRRLLWTVFVSFALCCALWQCSEMVLTYYSYPSHEKIMLVSSARQKFPAVTICNLNSVRLSAINKNFAMFTSLQVGGAAFFRALLLFRGNLGCFTMYYFDVLA
ncbi:hypothetical protein NDU88_011976 [Pleurodeles waltl]|uniref:Uncharacterized protein n=1 Tax=Pleurodeles waltl TaxID=8319 RepID=A0AAV7R2Y8_PLEWA|nr:hypothetical protein NDU88_011976 [Pleurodeles waltl]